RARARLQSRWRARGAFGEALGPVESLDVDRDGAVRRARENARELRVPPHFVPRIGGARGDPGGEGLLVRVDQNEQLGLRCAQALWRHSEQWTARPDGMHNRPVQRKELHGVALERELMEPPFTD